MALASYALASHALRLEIKNHMLQTVAHINLAKGFRGGERQSVLLMKYLKLRNPELKQFLICRPGGEIQKYVTDIPDLTIIEAKSALSAHAKLGSAAQILQAHEARAVHWAAIHNLVYKTPYVITRRVPQPVKNSWFNRFTFRHAAAVIGISQAIRESIVASFGASLNFSGRLGLIYSVLAHMEADPTETANIAKQYAGKLVIGHVGAYVDRHKGQKVLIPAAKNLIKKYPNLRFILLGNGSDEAVLKELTADTPEIEWLGFHKNVVDFIENMDIFVFPSRNEGLGSVLLDIMDHHVPIVASTVDGIPEIVHDRDTGLLFPNGDSQALEQALEELITKPELRTQLATSAYGQLAHFRPEYMAQRYDALYRSIIKGRTKAPLSEI